MPRRKRDIEELKNIVKLNAEDTIRAIRKGILKKRAIRRLNIASNILVNRIKEYEKNE